MTPMIQKAQKLTLIGAGPGDPELITIKAINALKCADIVLYDALVHKDLLEYAPQAERVFVGKRKGCAAYTQPEINQLIVDYAKDYGHVVRLKGGDPFVFGRGYEELEFAKTHGLEVALIPGITSAIAVPSSQMVPVTSRGYSESFWVITATTKEHKLSKDIIDAAGSNATVVILMGTHKLREIAAIYLEKGRADIPVMIIQNGTLPEEKVVKATMENIVEVAEKNQIANPAIIVIGAVVELSKLNALQKTTALEC